MSQEGIQPPEPIGSDQRGRELTFSTRFRHAAVLSRSSFFVGDVDCLPMKPRNVGDAEIEMFRHIAGDPKRN